MVDQSWGHLFYSFSLKLPFWRHKRHEKSKMTMTCILVTSNWFQFSMSMTYTPFSLSSDRRDINVTEQHCLNQYNASWVGECSTEGDSCVVIGGSCGTDACVWGSCTGCEVPSALAFFFLNWGRAPPFQRWQPPQRWFRGLLSRLHLSQGHHSPTLALQASSLIAFLAKTSGLPPSKNDTS